MTTLVVVDGANLVNDLGRSLAEATPSKADRSVQERYYREWFDIDRLVTATLGAELRLDTWKDLGITLFHSLRAPGEEGSVYRLEGKETLPFWARQGMAPNTATQLIQVPGPKEKGVDTAIVVHLFETIDSWESAVIFSNDADYVPAVQALRRRGKRVYCASPPNPDDKARPLVQACQSFLPWDMQFLRADRALFEAVQPGAALDKVFSLDNIRSLPWKLRLVGDAMATGCVGSPVAENLANEVFRAECPELCAISDLQLIWVADRQPSSAPTQLRASTSVWEGLRRNREQARAGTSWGRLLV